MFVSVGDGAIAYGEIIYALAQERMIVPTTNSMCLRASSIAILGGQRLLAGEKHDPLTLPPYICACQRQNGDLRPRAKGLASFPWPPHALHRRES